MNTLSLTKPKLSSLADPKFAPISETYKKESSRLKGFIRKKGNHQEEDILQDSFLRLMENYEKLNDVDSLLSWLYTAARNKIVDWFRKKKEDLTLDDPIKDGENLTLLDTLPSLGNSPEDQYLRSEMMNTIEKALAELPSEQREVFVWHEIEGRSFREIAQITHEKEVTLRARKRYAILALRLSLSELYQEWTNP